MLSGAEERALLAKRFFYCIGRLVFTIGVAWIVKQGVSSGIKPWLFLFPPLHCSLFPIDLLLLAIAYLLPFFSKEQKINGPSTFSFKCPATKEKPSDEDIKLIHTFKGASKSFYGIKIDEREFAFTGFDTINVGHPGSLRVKPLSPTGIQFLKDMVLSGNVVSLKKEYICAALLRIKTRSVAFTSFKVNDSVDGTLTLLRMSRDEGVGKLLKTRLPISGRRVLPNVMNIKRYKNNVIGHYAAFSILLFSAYWRWIPC